MGARRSVGATSRILGQAFKEVGDMGEPYEAPVVDIVGNDTISVQIHW